MTLVYAHRNIYTLRYHVPTYVRAVFYGLKLPPSSNPTIPRTRSRMDVFLFSQSHSQSQSQSQYLYLHQAT